MKPAQSGPPNEDDHCYDTTLNLTAAKLDVYRHERLAYTEAPTRRPARRPFVKAAIAALKAALRRAFSCFQNQRRSPDRKRRGPEFQNHSR